MKYRFLVALAAMGCVAGCAFPISDRMAKQQGIPTGKPVGEGYVGRALPVEEEEEWVEGEEGVEGEAPSGVAYPRKYTETGGGVGLSLRSTKFGRRSDYVLSNLTVNLHLDVAPKSKSPKRGFYAEVGFDLGYPETTLKINEIDGLSVGPRENDASLLIPYVGLDLGLIASEIEVGEIGFFEVEIRLGLSLIGGEYKDISIEGETEPHDISAITMVPEIAIIARRMAGKPIPLKYFEPFAGLAFDLAWVNLTSEPATESFLDYWLVLILGVRVRPMKNLYGELALDIGTFEQTITLSLGVVF